jgi:hypothetical protein
LAGLTGNKHQLLASPPGLAFFVRHPQLIEQCTKQSLTLLIYSSVAHDDTGMLISPEHSVAAQDPYLG